MATHDQTDEPQAETAEEQVEGLQDLGDGLGAFPLKELLIRQESRTLHGVLHRIDQQRYILDPDFQRDFVWTQEKQSRLIESVLMRIPMPVFYLAENDEGKMIVVDGLQRLSTFKRFWKDELKLKLPEHVELNGKKFSELMAKHQNRFEDCNLICYVIDPKVPDRARLDIFERVNSGVPLSRQQMRNALYSGPATQFLRDESRSQAFEDATGGRLNKKTMRDREFVNRFCSFHLLGVEAYTDADMDRFLAKGLKKMNAMDASEIKTLSEQFRHGLTSNYKVFKEHAFRKSILAMDGKRSVLNASLWDVMSTGLAAYQPKVIAQHADAVLDAVQGLLEDEEFQRTITSGTGGNEQVHTRFSMAQAALKEALPC